MRSMSKGCGSVANVSVGMLASARCLRLADISGIDKPVSKNRTSKAYCASCRRNRRFGIGRKQIKDIYLRRPPTQGSVASVLGRRRDRFVL